ncbi:U4/U6.U5 small nuclear ribonucleoprotein [Mycena sanguinolenta]|uniref:U4/U6.U5 small nuclear ribonucleoprotein n=1 Tax=Mycena sanguinolenta TaxID=230812 RepID=A0A8H6YNN7_9AGAR|nr:U4/U6.U5 small nuclear ribonucleoprotein [Mycena sanguinolenta]
MTETETVHRAPVAEETAIAMSLVATSPGAVQVVRAVPGEVTGTDAVQTAGITGTMIEETAIGGGETSANATVTMTQDVRGRGETTSGIARDPEVPPRVESLKSLCPTKRHPGQVDLPPKRLNLDPDAPDDSNEEGEEMEVEDEDMMAMMGLSGFGTTKGKHITGNQEGAVSVKKQRTWRQYMNRRGGFNRPLDKIK